MILVNGAPSSAGDKALPEARLTARTKAVAGLVPVIELTHYRDLGGIWGPDGEICAVPSVDGEWMGSKLVVEAVMGALIEEVEVVLCYQGDVKRYRLALLLFPACIWRLAAEIVGTHRSP